MRNLQPRMSLHTYALVFAAVLSPAWLQVAGCPSGNPDLAALAFEVNGVDQLNWMYGVDQYQVTMSSPTAVLRVQTVEPGSEIRYQWWADGVTYVDMWSLGEGDVEAEIDILEGYNLLRIDVRASGGKRGYTSIAITNSLAVAYPCTEEALLAAIAAGGAVEFVCSEPTTIATSAEIVISSDAILDGRGDLTIDGNDTHRVFSVPVGVTAELRGMTITGGGGVAQGGGIYNEGALTLTDGTVTGNAATWAGGGIYNAGTIDIRDQSLSENGAAHGAAMWNAGTATVTGTGFTGNTATGNGGGLYNDGSATVTESLFGQNTGNHGGGISSGNGDLVLTDTMVVDNAALGSSGGGILIEGTTAAVTLANSTVSGNTAIRGGGIYFTAPGALTLTNTTVSGNTASDTGGGIYYYADGSVTATNSTFRGNTAQADQGQAIRFINPPTWIAMNTIIEGSCDGPVSSTSAGWNIESPGDTCGFNNPTDSTGVSSAALDLGPLRYNGGFSLTHAPNEGSVAIDAIPLQGGSCTESTDQRGVTRPEGSSCDIGSVEFTAHIGSCGDGTIDPGEECDPPDGIACSPDCALSYDTGQCVGVPDLTPCDFGIGLGICEAEACQPLGSCASDADCDNADECTDDYCNPSLGSCLVTPVPNGRPCGGAAGGSGLCQNGQCQISIGLCFSNAECGDGNDCTEDRCDLFGNVCFHVPIPGDSWCDSGAGVCRGGVCSTNPEWAFVPETVWTASVFELVISSDVAMDAAGNAIATWWAFDAAAGINGSTVYSQRYDVASGVWGEQTSDGGGGAPTVVMNGIGDAALVWPIVTPNGLDYDYDIGARNYNHATNSWDFISLQLNDAGRNAGFPDVAIDPDGNAIAVWVQECDPIIPGHNFGDPITCVFASRYERTLGWGLPVELVDPQWESPCYLSEYGGPFIYVYQLFCPHVARDPQIAIDSSGNAVVVWTQEFNHTSDAYQLGERVYAQYYEASVGWPGGWTGPRPIDGNTTYQAPYPTPSKPQVAVDSAGNAIAVWEQKIFSLNPGGSSELIWNRYDKASSDWNGTRTLRHPDEGYALRAPNLAMDASGDAIVVYEVVGLGDPMFPWTAGYSSADAKRYLSSQDAWTGMMHAYSTHVAMGLNGNGRDWAMVGNDGQDFFGMTPHPASPLTIGIAAIIGSALQAGAPQVAMDGQRNAMAIWPEYDDLAWRIMANRFGPPIDGPISTFECTEFALRQAVAQGGNVLFDCNGPMTATLSEVLHIQTDLILDGTGELTIDGSGSPAGPSGRVVRIDPGVTVTLRNLTITGGNFPGFMSGIINFGGAVTLENVTVTGNQGGGIYNSSDGTLSMTDCTVSDHLGAEASLAIGISNDGTMTVTNSTISGNELGGVFNAGAATLINSTVSGNTAANGAGIFNYTSATSMVLVHTTVSNNTATQPWGGSIYNDATSMTVTNSLVAGKCYIGVNGSPLISGGHNIEIEEDSCGLSGDSSNLVGVDPQQVPLGSLRYNGGLTATHQLIPPTVGPNLAIDHIPSLACALPSDQRGVERPQPAGGACDVGAVEME